MFNLDICNFFKTCVHFMCFTLIRIYRQGNSLLPPSNKNKRDNVILTNIESCSCNHCCRQSNEYYIVRTCVCSLCYVASKAHVPYCHLWPVLFCCIFPHYLINGTIFFTTFIWNISHSKNNWARYYHNCTSSCKVPTSLVRFYWKLNILHRFSKNSQISNFMKVRAVGAEWYVT